MSDDNEIEPKDTAPQQSAPLKENSSPLVSLNVSDLFGLGKLANSPAATEVMKSIAGAIGALWSPVGSALEEELEGFERRRQSKLDADAAVKISVTHERYPEILAITKARILNTEVKRTQRIIAATRRAAEIANERDNEFGTIAKPVDSDFAMEWAEAVKDVSDDSVVDLFAVLLASAPSINSGRPPKAVLQLVQRLDGDCARLLRKLMDEWWVMLPVPKKRLSLSLTDEELSTLLILEDIGATSSVSSTHWHLLDWNLELFASVPPSERFKMLRVPQESVAPTEIARRLANLVAHTSDAPTGKFADVPYEWLMEDRGFIVKYGPASGFGIRSSYGVPLNKLPFLSELPDNDDLRRWVTRLNDMGKISLVTVEDDAEVFS